MHSSRQNHVELSAELRAGDLFTQTIVGQAIRLLDSAAGEMQSIGLSIVVVGPLYLYA